MVSAARTLKGGADSVRLEHFGNRRQVNVEAASARTNPSELNRAENALKFSRLHQLSEAPDPGAEMVSEVPKESSRLHEVTGLPGMAAEATMPMAWTKDMAMLNMQRYLKARADCDPLSSSSFSDYQDEDACRRSAAEELLESGSEEHRNLSEGVAEELLESRSEEHQNLFEGVGGELFGPGCEAAQNSCEESAEELLLESGSEKHQNVYRKVTEERFDFATPDSQPGAPPVPATNRGNVEEEEEALDLETDEAAEETMLGITSPAVAAAVTIASAPVSPIPGFNPIETFLLGEPPQQQQVIQQERVFNACSSMQGVADWSADQDVACANGVSACANGVSACANGVSTCANGVSTCANGVSTCANGVSACANGVSTCANGVSACANSAGRPGIDNYQCSCVDWDGTAFLSSLADLLPPAAAPGAGAAQEPLPPGDALPPDVVNPGCAVVALADGSDWLAAADNAIASFLIEAELMRINRVLLQAESAPHSTPLSSSPNKPRGSEAVSTEGCLRPDELFEAWCNGSFSRVLHGF
ncbi:unnamed protein product [Closterium sp. Naga37s-1]|nr:unnamed protein product [Closterium sp. Naga37s-1]